MGFFDRIFGKNKKYTTLTDDEFKLALRDTPKKILIDVRSKSEFDQLKIPDAMNIDIMNPNFEKRLDKMDKGKSYFIYCASGGRSARACKKLVKLGFEKIYNLKGGINQYTGRTV